MLAVSGDPVIGSPCSDFAQHHDSGPEHGIWHLRSHERIDLQTAMTINSGLPWLIVFASILFVKLQTAEPSVIFTDQDG
jgi:hypothetical protein